MECVNSHREPLKSSCSACATCTTYESVTTSCVANIFCATNESVTTSCVANEPIAMMHQCNVQILPPLQYVHLRTEHNNSRSVNRVTVSSKVVPLTRGAPKVIPLTGGTPKVVALTGGTFATMKNYATCATIINKSAHRGTVKWFETERNELIVNVVDRESASMPPAKTVSERTFLIIS